MSINQMLAKRTTKVFLIRTEIRAAFKGDAIGLLRIRKNGHLSYEICPNLIKCEAIKSFKLTNSEPQTIIKC